jgi:hypothetical protein
VSLPGLTRQSILFGRLFAKTMDARVKPAHDGVYALFLARGATELGHNLKW